jgi:hypothetical protein
MTNRPPVPEGWEFRLSPDRRLFAFYDPGNRQWSVPEPAMSGRFVDSPDIDLLGWYRYIPAPEETGELETRLYSADPSDQADAYGALQEIEGGPSVTLTPCAHVKSLHETEHDGLIVEGCSWCAGREQLGTPGHTKPLLRVTSTGVRPELTDAERAMLRYALDLVGDRMASEGDEFSDDDREAVASLKQLAGEE